MGAFFEWLVNYLADVTIGIVNHALDTPAVETEVTAIDMGGVPPISTYDDILDRYDWVRNRN